MVPPVAVDHELPRRESLSLKAQLPDEPGRPGMGRLDVGFHTVQVELTERDVDNGSQAGGHQAGSSERRRARACAGVSTGGSRSSRLTRSLSPEMTQSAVEARASAIR